jgi:hypothetical protein
MRKVERQGRTITKGAPQEAYRRLGFNFFTVRELLAPFEQSAKFALSMVVAPVPFHNQFSKLTISR